MLHRQCRVDIGYLLHLNAEHEAVQSVKQWSDFRYGSILACISLSIEIDISASEQSIKHHGLDLYNRRLVKDVIETFCQRPHKTMVMVTHYEEELPNNITNKIYLIKQQ